jgi:hypothetical protein
VRDGDRSQLPPSAVDEHVEWLLIGFVPNARLACPSHTPIEPQDGDPSQNLFAALAGSKGQTT